MDELATFTYIVWQDRYLEEKPFQVFSPTADDAAASTNLVFEDGPLQHINDARGHEKEYSLNQNGFAFCKHDVKDGIFNTAVQVEKQYLPEMERLLRQHVQDVTEVYFFDWRIRRNKDITKSVIDANDKMQHLLPARHVHIDQTPSAAVGRTLLHLPEKADRLLRGRVRIINLWRPLVHEVQDRPLALCDMRSVSADDVVEADHVRKQYNGSNYYLKFSSKYRWHYLSRQTRDEVTMIQMFDSEMEGVSGCPHSSFDLTHPPEKAIKRESIEVRALVFSS
ncbi:hypothetical protein H2200_010279 [Cladophialophora chaetospira]|uniref:Methyltransferase n=1 Tax=Cladophialophora chaetospira TaxID=386627 RepID=A0AA38X157_9EURO|nr:hypothetical protein H2200_010279 [Cladophialophora chaetospira]